MLRSSVVRRGCCIHNRDITLMDRVHEHITIPLNVQRAIDTAAFQRLRSLKQLGVSSYLYPGAVHTRFEHSIGVAHIAQHLLGSIQRRQPDLRISEEDKVKVMLAGLLHDVGHGPFSHLFEDVIARRCNIPFSHEDMSQRIARGILQGFLPLYYVEEVLALMQGRAMPHIIYSEIVSNKRNGIDVDKLDYFIRDSMCCFGKPTVDVRLNRLVNSARLVCHDGQWQFAFEEKLALSLRELFALRAKLHKDVYQHRVVKAVGHMIGDIMHAAAPHFLVCGHTLLECATDENLLVKVGDWILEAIESSADLNLKPARDIISRLRARDIYPLVFSRTISESVTLPSAWIDQLANDIIAEANSVGQRDITIEDLIIDLAVINHGKGSDDPLRSVLFFNPKRPSHPPFRMSSFASRRSLLFTPYAFEERTLMVFERRDTGGVVRQACEAVVSDKTYSTYFADSLPFYNPK
uniref:HD/PDEase domain-containing protein n=1 Tax=Trypanosoma congolense (strain IL3000) TaxID=1068625 RepID=G0UQC3_TRYCI|nr:conserved hypothetical protein [Trypanosoma congolense IL3000]